MEEMLSSTTEVASKPEEGLVSPEVSDRDASSHAGYSADVTSREEDFTTNAEMDRISPVAADDVDTSEMKIILQETLPMTSEAHSISADTTPIEATSGFMNDSTNPTDTDVKIHSQSVIVREGVFLLEPSSVITSEPGEVYVNHGLVAWEKNREQWLETNRGSGGNSGRKHAKPIPVDEIIDAIFTTPKKLLLNGGVSEAFPVSVPLPQLVDILQDLWEAETM